MKFSEWFGEDLTGRTYNGNLDCEYIGLTSLEGCPEIITGDFDCSGNDLTSLVHGPKKVGGAYYCMNNRLTSLNGVCYSQYLVSDFTSKDVRGYLIKHYPEMYV